MSILPLPDCVMGTEVKVGLFVIVISPEPELWMEPWSKVPPEMLIPELALLDSKVEFSKVPPEMLICDPSPEELNPEPLRFPPWIVITDCFPDA